MFSNNDLLQGHSHLITTSPTATSQSSPSPLFCPITTVDKASTNGPASITFTYDQLRHCLGFRNIDNVAKHLPHTSKNTYSISTADKEPIMDLGDVATIHPRHRTTANLPLPTNPYDIVHIDIVFGTKTAIGGIKYALFIVDRASRKRHIYSLTSLKHDLLPALIKFCSEIGRKPSRILTDFDHKLCVKKVIDHFTDPDSQSSIIESAPPKHQNQNGLAERNWGTILCMAQSWLASSLLPFKFWFLALK